MKSKENRDLFSAMILGFVVIALLSCRKTDEDSEADDPQPTPTSPSAENPNPGTEPQILATIAGAPTNRSLATTLDVTVGGDKVVSYRYKVQESAAGCVDEAGYSDSKPVATKISADIASKPNGQDIFLCVIGIGETSAQPFSTPTTATWKKIGPVRLHASYRIGTSVASHGYALLTAAGPTLESVDASTGELSDIQLDKDLVPRISVRRSDGTVNVLAQSESSWTSLMAVSASGQRAEMAIGSDNVSRVATFKLPDTGPGFDLKVYRAAAGAPVETVATNIKYSSLSYTIGNDDSEYLLVGGEETSGPPGRLKIATRSPGAGGAWTSLTAVETDKCYSYLVADWHLDVNGIFHIVYHCRQQTPAATCELRHAKKSAASGGQWVDTALETIRYEDCTPPPAVGGLLVDSRPSVAVGKNGYLHVAHDETEWPYTRYISMSPEGKIDTEIVDDQVSGTTGFRNRTRVLVDGNSDVHVLYQKTPYEIWDVSGAIGAWSRQKVIGEAQSVFLGDAVIEGVRSRSNANSN